MHAPVEGPEAVCLLRDYEGTGLRTEHMTHMTVGFHRSVVVCAVHAHAVTCTAAPRLTARNSDDVLIQTTESEVTFFFSRKYVRHCGVENQYLRIF